MVSLIQQLASDNLIEKAYDSVCHNRRQSSCHNDIWDLRWNWTTEKNLMQQQLLSGSYVFGTTRMRWGTAGLFEEWSARDQIVLTGLKILLQRIYKEDISASCYNMQGNGGMKAAVRAVARESKHYKYVYKSDISNYYASINHSTLYYALRDKIHDKQILSLIHRFLVHSIEYNGTYKNIRTGISRGTPLSGLLGCIYLKSLDDVFEKKTSCCYVRYMDDFIFMTNHKYVHRRYIRKINQMLNTIQLSTAFEKTYVGTIGSSGFDFLGYHFTKATVSVANITITRFEQKRTAKVHRWWNRFYESGLKGLTKLKGEKTLSESISLYEHNWRKWCNAGVMELLCNIKDVESQRITEHSMQDVGGAQTHA